MRPRLLNGDEASLNPGFFHHSQYGIWWPRKQILLPPRFVYGEGWGGVCKEPPFIPPQAGGDKTLLAGVEDSVPATRILKG